MTTRSAAGLAAVMAVAACSGSPEAGAPSGSSAAGGQAPGSGGAGGLAEVATGPITLASDQGEPWAIALDATHVYWTNYESNKVMKVAIAGGAAVELASSNSPKFIALDDSKAYWTASAGAQGGTIESVPLAGGPVAVLIDHESSPWAIAVDDVDLYWTTINGAAKAMPKGGGALPRYLGGGSGVAAAMVLDTDDVFWTVSGNTDVAGLGGEVYMKGKDKVASGVRVIFPRKTLAMMEPGVWGLAIDDANVYWSNRKLGKVMRLARAGGVPSELVTDQNDPTSLAVDGANVYWTNDKGGTVMKAPLTGGPATTIADGQERPTAIAVDAANIYWVTTGGDGAYNGKVIKLRKD